MKRWAIGFVFVLFFSVFASAQAAHFVQWDPNPVADGVTFYTVTFDATTVVSVPPVVDAVCSCVQWQLPALSNGNHAISVTATNQWGTSAPSTLTFNVTGPGTIKNIRIR